MAESTVTSKGQVTIPKEVREHLGVREGDRLVFRRLPDGSVMLEVRHLDFRSLRGRFRARGLDVDRAIAAGSKGIEPEAEE